MDIQNQDSFELINVENFDIPSNTLHKPEEKQNNNTTPLSSSTIMNRPPPPYKLEEKLSHSTPDLPPCSAMRHLNIASSTPDPKHIP